MNSIIKPADLFKRAAELEMSAVGVVDNFSLAAISDSYKVAKTSKVKMIVGCQLNFVDALIPFYEFNSGKVKEKPTEKIKNIVLIAKTQLGYRNLLLLNKAGFDCRLGRLPLIDWRLLEKYKNDLICLTGDACGILGMNISNGNSEKAKEDAIKLKNIFGDDLALELIPNNLKYNGCDQFAVNRYLFKLSTELEIKAIAASNAKYLYKEQHKVHDLVMAIKHGRSLGDKSRPRFEFEQLYLHSAEDIIKFFTRNFGVDFANSLCENTIYFADKCEKPNWVKPDFITGDKSQLPTFPVKDDEDYLIFKSWLENQSDKIKKIDEDKQFMRFKCQKDYDKLIPTGKEKIYKDRMDRELEVFEALGFSSYMLITHDFINWARKQKIPVGPGRGCLVGETLVLTENGFKQLKDINVGDKVYTHTGQLQNVLNKFEFDVANNEDLLEIKTELSFGRTSLTKEHLVYGCKKTLKSIDEINNCENQKIWEGTSKKIKFVDPEWIKAEDLNIGDYVYTKFPKINETPKYEQIFDLADFAKPKNICNDKIRIENKIINNLSVREVSRQTKVPFEAVRRAKNKILKNETQLNLVKNYLDENNISLNDWIALPKFSYYYIDRYIPITDDFLYILGLWVGDGCLRSLNSGLNYAFHINEKEIIEKTLLFYTNLGLNIHGRTSDSNCWSCDIGTYLFGELFKLLFPFYKRSSYTKHLPLFFRKLNNNQLICLIKGVEDSDGYINGTCESIKTTSLQLAEELKECFDKLNIPCGVLIDKANDTHGRNNATSYLIRFSGINTPLKNNYIYNNGYYSKIIGIENCINNKVYDITVENDASYLTSSGIMHNSVGGSIVGYSLGIHMADSIKYGLIFERFLNMDKREFPDIDNDFDSEGREKVLSYVTEKYGKDYVAHVSNFMTFTPKVAITDVITSLEIGGSRQDAFKIAKNITETIDAGAKTMKDALASSKLFAEFCKEHPEILEYAEPLLGVIRSYATHAAGVVIGKYPLPGLVPLRLDDNGVVALEWEKTRAEENGLVKIDFLGLETLNVIKNTNAIINSLNEPEPENPPNFDKKYPEVYDLITNGKTFGVFQLGASGGTIGLCNMTQPKNIEDIAIINALARPGVPSDIKKSFIDRKLGNEKIVIPHPNLKHAVEATLGYCVFEESFMFLAHDFCGWDLQKSDKMRKISKLKAKGKQILEELQEDFIKSSCDYSKVKPEFAKKIWDEWIIPLSGYAFNKSHSILYSMTSLHTAYLKAYYHNEFMTANLISETHSNSPASKENILKIRHELRKAGVNILPPKINDSFTNYRLIDKNTLITGMAALHGVKAPAAENIMANRPFASFEDLLLRTDASKARAPTIQAMAACGALDCFGLSRKAMYTYCSDLRKKSKTWHERNPDKKFEYSLPTEEWTIGEIRAFETHFIGEALSGNKTDSFPDLFSGHRAVSLISKVITLPEKNNVVIEGEVIDMFTFKVKKPDSKIYGQECCKMLVEDINNDQVNVVFFPDQYKRLKYLFEETLSEKFEKGFGIRVSGNTSKFGNDTSIIASDVYGLFEPIGLPADLTQKKIKLLTVKNKKIKEVTKEDVEDELMIIINEN